MNTTTTSTSTSPEDTPSRARGRGVIMALAGISVGGLAAIIGARVKEANATRAALDASRPTAEATAARPAPRVVRGAPQTWQPTVPLTGTLAPIQEADIGFKTG